MPLPTFATIAADLLAAAVSSGVTVARSFVAPGPAFARDCRLLAVEMETPAVVPLQREFAGACAGVRQVTFRVVFAADCVPTFDDDGNPPAPTAIDAWSTAFLADCDAVFLAVLTGIDDLGVDCESVSVGRGVMTGPTGGVSTMQIPVTVTMT